MSSIDPDSARTAEDFVVLLRQARAMSQLTYWELEERAEAAGHELAPAVLVEALGLATLPDEDLVVALLHACGHTGGEIDQWLSVRARLADALADPAVRDPAVREPAGRDPAGQGPASREPARLRPAGRGPDGFGEENALSPALAAALSATPSAASAASRPRHTLRIPGRGTRRAPGSLLRPLAMAMAAAVVGIGSIAVIVSAVNDGDASGPPVYAPGGPPHTAPAPLSSEAGGPADPSGTPFATPSASRTAPPSSPAQTGVLRSGTATLQNGQNIDLDGGGSDPDIEAYGEGDSIRAGPSSRHFAPEPTATRQACAAVTAYQKSIQGLTAGKGICVRTDEGRYAHITVTRTAPLAFSYVVWS